jgi:group I intron endonuclease
MDPDTDSESECEYYRLARERVLGNSAGSVPQAAHKSLGPATVYMFTSPSGKRYIGETKRTLSQRLARHKDLERSHCRLVVRAIKKYGWDSMVVSVLWRGPPSERRAKEAEFIAKYDTMSPNGYNCTAGGDSNPMDVHAGRIAVKESWQRPEVKQRHKEGRQRAWSDPVKRANIMQGREKSINVVRAKKEMKWNTPEANAKRSATWESTREQRLCGLEGKARVQKLARLKRDRERNARKRAEARTSC